MFYNLTKPFAKVALAIYFRKIHFSNQHVVPKNKPVILAANHPTAFIEPCILSCWLDQPLSFIARGDIYLNSFIVRTLYRMYRLVPVFRIDDAGYGQLKNNYDTFDYCFDALSKNKALMILAEGRTKHEKRLRPIMKGTARIVFGALEKHGDLDIHIVPAGVNYTDADKFRSDVMIDFGPPIRARDYKKLYEENPAKAISALTLELSHRLKERVIHIKKDDDVELVERLFKMKRNDNKTPRYPIVSNSDTALFAEKRISDAINKLPEPEKAALSTKVNHYFDALQKAGVTDLGLKRRFSYHFLKTVAVIAGWLPAMLGYLFNFPPLFLADLIARKLAPSIEFRASVAGVFGSLLWLIYFIGIIAGLWLTGLGWWPLSAFLLPVLGYFHLLYREEFEKWNEGRKVSGLDKTQLDNLMKMRKEIQISEILKTPEIYN